jgi:uncharacterized protein
MIDWPVAALFISGGIVGSVVGTAAAKRLSAKAGLLKTLFAILIFVVAIYMLWKSALAI